MAQPRNLFRYERTSGLLMILAMALALAAVNSPLRPLYDAVHHIPVHLRIGPLIIDKPLAGWINQGLMVIFFLLMGLEIKRQFIEGHLSSRKQAALPFFAALGGMIIPAAIYSVLNWDDPDLIRGWAVPTATDIVLALGVLSLLGRRVPACLKVFLTALAIFDDIGAVAIIGLFYGEGLSVEPLLFGALALIGLAALNRFGVTRLYLYIGSGALLWLAMLQSGLEAALSGVLIALAVPMRVRGCGCRSPLREAERSLHPWGSLVVVPLFAFFNSGVPIEGASLESALSPASLGIVLGLFLGKQLGVMTGAWTAVRLGIGALPRGIGWKELYGVAILAGVGFTMSLFIAALAFPAGAVGETAKLSILVGSLVSAVAGLLLLTLATRR